MNCLTEASRPRASRMRAAPINTIVQSRPRNARHDVQDNLNVPVVVHPPRPDGRVEVYAPQQLTGLTPAKLAKPGVNNNRVRSVSHADILSPAIKPTLSAPRAPSTRIDRCTPRPCKESTEADPSRLKWS